ncbi:hypothetical protein MTO96_016347 [Rhipicephalus appendiculatus]
MARKGQVPPLTHAHSHTRKNQKCRFNRPARGSGQINVEMRRRKEKPYTGDSAARTAHVNPGPSIQGHPLSSAAACFQNRGFRGGRTRKASENGKQSDFGVCSKGSVRRGEALFLL